MEARAVYLLVTGAVTQAGRSGPADGLGRDTTPEVARRPKKGD